MKKILLLVICLATSGCYYAGPYGVGYRSYGYGYSPVYPQTPYYGGYGYGGPNVVIQPRFGGFGGFGGHGGWGGHGHWH